MTKRRAILIVLDSAGIGSLPDAADFGDAGANTFGHIYQARNKLQVPNLYALGLAAIEGSGLPAYDGAIAGAYGRAAEKTHAKDTTCGHWEMGGIIMQEPFKTYPQGFPPRIINEFERRTGRGTLGNCVASGTEIIQRLGDEHVATGKPIVYTSADSVFQVAAHEDVIPLSELYAICEAARAQLVGEDLVGRVIARPFVGANGSYTRTENRRDFAIPPIEDTILDGLTAEGYETVAVGKIEDIFFRRGISISDHAKNNREGIETTLRFIREGTGDFIFTNLVDFDMLYGHRNDVEGYGAALEYFDTRLAEIKEAMREGDLLLLTADHGCDPTWPGTDHTREYIPVLAWYKGMRAAVALGTLPTFADLGSTVFDYITGRAWRVGDSFLSKLGIQPQ
ncbi:MAG: phosphopentomutase [Christensenellaceae bacterium]|jgi:phosphopentomutase|nr:phosphopentomutase [Christensenellaceae bacterium]